MRALGTKKGNFHMVFYEIHETTNSVYLVIEYLTGGELLKAIEKNKNLSETLIKKIMKNFIKGLNYCHSLKIMHRDLKPENIMLSSKSKIYKIKLIDFGLA